MTDAYTIATLKTENEDLKADYEFLMSIVWREIAKSNKMDDELKELRKKVLKYKKREYARKKNLRSSKTE
jgi:hypothetical protein